MLEYLDFYRMEKFFIIVNFPELLLKVLNLFYFEQSRSEGRKEPQNNNLIFSRNTAFWSQQYPQILGGWSQLLGKILSAALTEEKGCSLSEKQMVCLMGALQNINCPKHYLRVLMIMSRNVLL